MKLLVPLASECSLILTPPLQPAPAPLPGFADDSRTVFHVEPHGSTRWTLRAALAGCAALGPSTTVFRALRSVYVSEPLSTGIAPAELRNVTLAPRVTPQKVWNAALSACRATTR